jgi:hypothetical protein
MSATQTQTTEDKAKAASLKFLQSYAGTAGLDLNSCSEQMFRVWPEDLSKEQRLDLLRMLLKAQPKPESHEHPCVECGDSIRCDQTGCNSPERLCYSCKEKSGEYDKPSRYYFNGQWQVNL